MRVAFVLAAALATTGGAAGCLVPGPVWVDGDVGLWWYYPDVRVYYSPSARLYWYLDGAAWMRAATLPARVVLHAHREIHHRGAEPWRDHSRHAAPQRPGGFRRP
jgi:hypothetical protein